MDVDDEESGDDSDAGSIQSAVPNPVGQAKNDQIDTENFIERIVDHYDYVERPYNGNGGNPHKDARWYYKFASNGDLL